MADQAQTYTDTGDSSVTDKAKDAAGQVKDQVREQGQKLASTVQERAEDVREQAGTKVREEVDTRSTAVAEQVTQVAGVIRKAGEQLRDEGNDSFAKYADQAAEKVEGLGMYLRDSDGRRILSDIEDFARKQPWVAAGVGVAAGFVVGRLIKASAPSAGGSGSGYEAVATGDDPYRTYDSAGFEPGTGSYGEGTYSAPGTSPQPPVGTGTGELGDRPTTTQGYQEAV